ncbi:DUF4198 domain-containing protein [Microbulbifer mangrovi]|uniref:DUF4198 domain-containing protein n=1 Tax=Microbulbifer mangrovi TaxID=927787 RepID=UPI00117D26EA|nr:DUF4198 domain-containing protein [Microbulbifer mangrovi]
MSILDLGKACTFSQMQLEITYKGEPAPAAKVWRRVKWQKEKVDEFKTDEEGRVELPEIMERSVMQLLPSEFVVSQAIVVTYMDEEYKIWVNSKRSPEKNSELDGSDIHLKCELTDERRLVSDYESDFLTSCEII